MKLYTSVGPNPRVVRMFAAEKNIPLELVQVDLMKGENRQAAHLARNPAGQMPTLETDGGQMISEITVICEYLEEKQPNPPLIGTTPEERALTRMWTRRIDLNICEPLANGFRYAEGAMLFKDRIPIEPDAAPGLKRVAQNRLAWLDKMIEGHTWITGDKFSLADVLLVCVLEFGQQVGQPINQDNKNIAAWYERVKARPAVAATN